MPFPDDFLLVVGTMNGNDIDKWSEKHVGSLALTRTIVGFVASNISEWMDLECMLEASKYYEYFLKKGFSVFY